jgi:hypothetical protein
MPWFAWAYLIAMFICCVGIIWCAENIGRSTKRIKEVQRRRQ